MASEDKTALENNCVASAIAIRKLVASYRDTFTLRRTPFLLSYAVYSAVIVILRQSKHDYSQQYKEAIRFFLLALAELQRGCNFGLRKPVAIIRKMISELGGHLSQFNSSTHSDTTAAQMGEMWSFQAPFSNMADLQTDFSVEFSSTLLDSSPDGLFDFHDDQGQTLTDDVLYGLLSYQAAPF
jgi:hypothetical protein